MSAKGEKTREYILNSSYALFADKGYKQVTMKDVCEVTDMSRGGLYSHFSSTAELFEALLEKITKRDEVDFRDRIKNGESATDILNDAFDGMEKEMMHQEDSLSIAMYEYAQTVSNIALNWLALAGFILLFAFLSMLVLEFIDKDKR